jgi:hypothetical protein
MTEKASRFQIASLLAAYDDDIELIEEDIGLTETERQCRRDALKQWTLHGGIKPEFAPSILSELGQLLFTYDAGAKSIHDDTGLTEDERQRRLDRLGHWFVHGGIKPVFEPSVVTRLGRMMPPLECAHCVQSVMMGTKCRKTGFYHMPTD